MGLSEEGTWRGAQIAGAAGIQAPEVGWMMVTLDYTMAISVLGLWKPPFQGWLGCPLDIPQPKILWVCVWLAVGTEYGTGPLISLQDFALSIWLFLKIKYLVLKKELENELK